MTVIHFQITRSEELKKTTVSTYIYIGIYVTKGVKKYLRKRFMILWVSLR